MYDRVSRVCLLKYNSFEKMSIIYSPRYHQLTMHVLFTSRDVQDHAYSHVTDFCARARLCDGEMQRQNV